MRTYDLKKMPAFNQKEKNVFFQMPEFKARIIELLPDGEIPDCDMKSYVMFYVVQGSAEITVNDEKTLLTEGKCLITEPATVAIRSQAGARIMGVQIIKRQGE